MVIKDAILCSPFCSSSKISKFYNGYEHLQYCENCSLLIKKNDKNYLEKKVINLEKFNKNVNDVITTKYYKKQIIECENQLKKIIKISKRNPKKILDYGCGYGSFLFACKNLNFSVEGYDINTNFTSNFKKFFVTIDSKTDLLKNKKKKYDLIFCRKVLNLTPNLYEDFNTFDQILHDDGVLVVLDQVKNLSKHKSILTQNNNNTLLLSKQSLEYYASKFNLKLIYFKNDFGDAFIIFKKIEKKIHYDGKMTLNGMLITEKYSKIFLILSNIKNFIKNIFRILKFN